MKIRSLRGLEPKVSEASSPYPEKNSSFFLHYKQTQNKALEGSLISKSPKNPQFCPILSDPVYPRPCNGYQLRVRNQSRLPSLHFTQHLSSCLRRRGSILLPLSHLSSSYCTICSIFRALCSTRFTVCTM